MSFNFCFGFRMNHCDYPVSMSYFFIVPDRNVTLQGKLTHDDSYEIPGEYKQYCCSKSTMLLYDPQREKTSLRGFRPGLTQTGLYSLRGKLDS